MAIYMQDETARLRCKKCGQNTFFEREVSGYTFTGKEGVLEKVTDRIEIRCSECEALAASVKHKVKKKGEN